MTNYIISNLHEMPDWTNPSSRMSELQDKILDILYRIDKYESNLIRKAINVYFKSDATIKDMGNILIVNKFLFDLPSWIHINSYVCFGGWLGVPEKKDCINLLWPFSKSKKGHLVLTGRFQGYMGETYLGLKAFDYYRRKYIRRNSEYDE